MPAWLRTAASITRYLALPIQVSCLTLGDGNKQEYEAGMMMNFGNCMVFPRLMYRDNLVDANPFIPPSIDPGGILNPGAAPRNTDADPFAVLGNREARAAEVFMTYDPTGATQFFAWDNDWREDAKFAFNVGGGLHRVPDAYRREPVLLRARWHQCVVRCGAAGRGSLDRLQSHGLQCRARPEIHCENYPRV